jgi:hypothetical protein
VVRVNLDDFSTVTIIDLTQKDPALRGFVGGFGYGRFGVLVPYSNGRTGQNAQNRSEFGTVVRVDVSAWTLDTVKAIDLPTVHRQQVGQMVVMIMRMMMIVVVVTVIMLMLVMTWWTASCRGGLLNTSLRTFNGLGPH